MSRTVHNVPGSTKDQKPNFSGNTKHTFTKYKISQYSWTNCKTPHMLWSTKRENSKAQLHQGLHSRAYLHHGRNYIKYWTNDSTPHILQWGKKEIMFLRWPILELQRGLHAQSYLQHGQICTVYLNKTCQSGFRQAICIERNFKWQNGKCWNVHWCASKPLQFCRVQLE